MIVYHFFGMPIKTLASLGKTRVGRVTGNTHMFWPNNNLVSIIAQHIPFIQSGGIGWGYPRITL